MRPGRWLCGVAVLLAALFLRTGLETSRGGTEPGDSGTRELRAAMRNAALGTDVHRRTIRPVAGGVNEDSVFRRMGHRLPDDTPQHCPATAVSGGCKMNNKSHVFICSAMSPCPALREVRFVTNRRITYSFTLDLAHLRHTARPAPASTVLVTMSGSESGLQWLLNWLVALSRVPLRGVALVVVALDAPTDRWLAGRGLPSYAVPLSDPHAMRFVRPVVWQAVLALGYRLIFSDVDAIWTGNPVPDFFARTPHAVLISQGGSSPMPLVERWGHVVSDGLFFAQPANLTHRFLATLLEDLATKSYVTLEDAPSVALAELKVRWQLTARHYKVFTGGILIRCYESEVTGQFPNTTETIALLPHSYFVHQMIRLDNVTLRKKPHIVKIFLNRKFANASQKMEAMKPRGLWHLSDDWENRSFDGDLPTYLASVSTPVQLSVHYEPKVLVVKHYLHPPLFPPDNSTHLFMHSELSSTPNVTEYAWESERFQFTFAIDRAALRQRLLTCAKDNLVVVAFSNSAFLDMLLNWLVALHRVGIAQYLVVAMDEPLHGLLQRRGVPSFLIGAKHVTALLSIRTIVWHTIAEAGVHFIHTDIDAVWLRNPLPGYLHPGSPHDMVFTQGTLNPTIALEAWGFVLCSGLFFAKATHFSTAVLFEVLRSQLLNPLVPRRYTDQDALNIIILKAGPKWTFGRGVQYIRYHLGLRFKCSRRVIAGTFNHTNATIGVLPYHLFMRTNAKRPDNRTEAPTQAGCWEQHTEGRDGGHRCLLHLEGGSLFFATESLVCDRDRGVFMARRDKEPPAAYVKHFFSVNRAKLNLTKSSVLRQHGLWLLRPDWNATTALRGASWLTALRHPRWVPPAT